ncbi:TylF/MycF/NovP-related O-methyltransferase [Saccharibacillus kuerlensis]|uniref:Methyltransferase n=1 Tax=Saccharibacillus kuerlensis TaxID=459527 RepID=A0ABQ2KTS0_9BACL|nr:TylF/MycF/NovP-related O-methyltransferase [Saccharibacillus kuerlensis]GGN93178.1 hypothetical protein GCM10010969_06450 [Saccharibacillus kuerlensis]
MKKIILCGAGDGGLRAKYSLTQGFEVVAFTDNNPKKQGNTFLGKPIISPSEIKEWDYDYVVVSNIHGDQVIPQLINEYGVSPDKIIDLYHNLMFDTRVAMLRQVADEINDSNITGAVAELGVYQGEFAQYINSTFPDRPFYLFDTFEGFHETDISYDTQNEFSDAQVGEFQDTTPELVLKRMPYSEQCIIRQGFFPETAQNLEEQFVFVSIDVDLYQPIFEGLKYFYPRLQKGGYIFIHDYNNSRFFGVKEAVKNYCRSNNIGYVPVNDLCGSVIIVK